MPRLSHQSRNSGRGVAQTARGKRWRCKVAGCRIYMQWQPGTLTDLEHHNTRFHQTQSKETP